MKEQEKTIEEFADEIDPSSEEFKKLSSIDNLISSLDNKYSLSEIEKNIIDGELTLFIIKKPNKEGFFDNLRQQLLIGSTNELVEKIMRDLYFFLEEKSSSIPDTVSPVDILSSIKERLSQSSTIASTKRDYSVDRLQTSQTDINTSKSLVLDPYRELPEK